ncbi:hypothetical protein C8J25_109136 [Sphingomonas faeni]|uniref:Uncharacterized protein n=1 Tax=Sphingomonas faeni TaxID=185950 RepID=A0A2T5TZP0_9SPHN|nr:hypothetical protein [Sphingomonas faeni]PTW44706.1 hypothetical protein C8J25_109136 [Sphingomonas faeni]
MPFFEQLRVSLARDEVGPLLEAIKHEESYRSRRAFLEAAFSKSHSFLHSKTGKAFDFSPIEIDGDYVAGIFKRGKPVSLHDHALRPYNAENYEGAFVFISLAKDQLVWAQYNHKVGSTRSLLESYFSYLSDKTDVSDWQVYVEYLHDEREYWTVIDEKVSEIAKITFTFIPPNALSADDEIYNLIKAVKQEANPDIQQHVYKAEPGKMKPNTEHMNASARIAMAGGGDADVRDRGGRVLYSSAHARVTREVPADEMPTPDNAPLIQRVRDWLFKK